MFALDVLLTAALSFIITFLAIPIVLQVAEKKKLYDIPDNRKLHTRPITSLGGVGIFIGFIFSVLLSIQVYQDAEFQYFFAAAIVIFFLGLKDDLVILSATKKFIGQLIAASIIIHLGGIRLDSMFGLFGIEQVHEGFGLALSYLTIIVVMNSFNLIDGIDGLAASLGILSMLVFGAYFFAAGYQSYALLAFSLAGSLVSFMIFNHHPAKIFMGDSGSLMIGLINSILVIKFINVANSPLSAIPVASAAAVGFAVLSIPLLDTLRVFTIRIVNGRSPFSPDRNHLHHLLLDRGLGHVSVMLTCLSLNVLFILIAWLGKSTGTTYLFLIMLSLAFSGFGLLNYYKPRRKIVISKNSNGVGIKEVKVNNSKIITLTKESQVAE